MDAKSTAVVGRCSLAIVARPQAMGHGRFDRLIVEEVRCCLPSERAREQKKEKAKEQKRRHEVCMMSTAIETDDIIWNRRYDQQKRDCYIFHLCW